MFIIQVTSGGGCTIPYSYKVNTIDEVLKIIKPYQKSVYSKISVVYRYIKGKKVISEEVYYKRSLDWKPETDNIIKYL